VAATPAELEAYAARLGFEPPPDHGALLELLAASGYVRVAVGPAYLICDCAAVGPRYQPGHAHADTLSFELSLAEQRVFVNSGVSEYGNRPERHRQRGTAAHNTVVVNGQDSSEVWSAFRVARRARARINRVGLEESAIVEACHDGYLRLPGRNRHVRCWNLDRHALRIEDRISGHFQHAEAHFHLHPEIDAQQTGSDEISLRCHGRELATVAFGHAAAVQIGRGTWHPRFGVVVPNSYISATFATSSLTSQIRWGQQ
jgi:uncharacterized heparinase superfamily protein